MSVRTATTKEKPLVIYSRVDEAGVPKIFRFRNSDGTPHDISGYDFEYILKSKPGNGDYVFKLTVGGGLTVQGTGNADLKLDISNENASIRPMTYFGRLYSASEDHTWLNNDHVFHDGKFDGIDNPEETITIYENGEDVVIEITQEGISQAELDAALALSVLTEETTATLTPSPTYDCFALTEQTTALTIANPSTNYPNFDGFIARVYTASAQTLTMGNKYRDIGDDFPATTEAGKIMIVTAIYDSSTDMYDTRISFQV